MNLVANESVRMNRLETRVSGVLMNRVRSVNTMFMAELGAEHIDLPSASVERLRRIESRQLAAALDSLPFSLMILADLDYALSRTRPQEIGRPSECVRTYLYLARELTCMDYTADCAGALLGIRDVHRYARLSDEDIVHLAGLPAQVKPFFDPTQLFDGLGRPVNAERMLSLYINRLAGWRR
jgi:hypothetical protein